MKKSLLTLTALSTLMAAGAANAAFISSDIGQFNGTVDFAGRFVEEKTTNWAWQIPEEIKLFAAKQDVNLGKGAASNGNKVYDVGQQGVGRAFLEGLMEESSIGAAGLKPTVMINSTAVVPGANADVTVPAFANNGAQITGLSLSFDLNTAAVVAKEATGVMSWSYDDASDATLSARALSVIIDNYMGADADKFVAVGGTGSGTANVLDSLASGTDKQVGAWFTEMSNIQLVVPDSLSVTPQALNTWSATVPVVVTQA